MDYWGSSPVRPGERPRFAELRRRVPDCAGGHRYWPRSCGRLTVPTVGRLPLTVPRFVQTPKLLLILTEWNAGYRQIFLDGHPLPVDPQPSWNWYMVVQTNGFRDGIWLDLKGDPLTEAARLTERFRGDRITGGWKSNSPWTIHVERVSTAGPASNCGGFTPASNHPRRAKPVLLTQHRRVARHGIAWMASYLQSPLGGKVFN